MTFLLLSALITALYLGSCFCSVSYGYRTTSITGPTAQSPQSFISQGNSTPVQQNATSMGFGAVLQTASYDNAMHNSPLIISADLKMLASTGIDSIRVDLDYDPWLFNNQAEISQMNSTIQSVRSAGLKLIIADAAAESYRHGGQLPWDQFQSAWIKRVTTLASAYHPDYYIVIKEPGWYVDLVSDSRTNPQFQSTSSWLALTNRLASAVLSVSPNTKVGISVAADSLGSNPQMYVPYLQGVEKIPAISFIGFDIYSSSGMVSTAKFLSMLGSGGKSVWIAETWSTDGSAVYDSSRAQTDATWIQEICNFAHSQINASMIIPFYTNDFSGYYSDGSIPSPSFFNSREPAYFAYKSIIQSVGQGV